MTDEVNYEIRATSLFIVIDHSTNKCEIKLIDMTSVCEYENTNHRDAGFIFGLNTLKDIFSNIKNGISKFEDMNLKLKK